MLSCFTVLICELLNPSKPFKLNRERTPKGRKLLLPDKVAYYFTLAKREREREREIVIGLRENKENGSLGVCQL